MKENYKKILVESLDMLKKSADVGVNERSSTIRTDEAENQIAFDLLRDFIEKGYKALTDNN